MAYNEHADYLASTSIFNGEETTYSLTFGDVIPLHRHPTNKKWKEEWTAYRRSSNSRYLQLYRDIPLKPWFDTFALSRKHTVAIIRLKFGHASYGKHLHRIGVRDTNLCETCNELEDLEHIFFACKKYANQSLNFINSLMSTCNPPCNTLHLLSLGLNYKSVITCIINLIDACNLSL